MTETKPETMHDTVLNFYTTSERNKAFNMLREHSIKAMITSFTSISTDNAGLDMIKAGNYNYVIDMR